MRGKLIGHKVELLCCHVCILHEGFLCAAHAPFARVRPRKPNIECEPECVGDSVFFCGGRSREALARRMTGMWATHKYL